MALGGLVLALIAIFFPPIPVIVRRGCGSELLINILLLFLGWIPGIMHAWYVILESPSYRQRRRARKEEKVYVRAKRLSGSGSGYEGKGRSRSRSGATYGNGYGARRTETRSLGGSGSGRRSASMYDSYNEAGYYPSARTY